MGTFSQHFIDWAQFTVVREPALGTFDGYGQPQYGAPQDVTCHIENRVRMVRNTQGNEVVSTRQLICFGGPFDVHDRFTLPASVGAPNQSPVLTVENIFDKAEFSHVEVFL